jgi:hypothetical protein
LIGIGIGIGVGSYKNQFSSSLAIQSSGGVSKGFVWYDQPNQRSNEYVSCSDTLIRRLGIG